MKVAVRAVGWLSVVVALLALAIYGVGAFSNSLYVHEPLYYVAQYAEPWRTVVAIIASVFPFALWWRVPRRADRVGASVSVVVLTWGLSLGVAVELGKGIFLDLRTGEISVDTFVINQRRFRIEVTTDGICSLPDFHNPFIWRIGGHALVPRALPLPLDDQEFKDYLEQSHADQERSAPWECRERPARRGSR